MGVVPNGQGAAQIVEGHVEGANLLNMINMDGQSADDAGEKEILRRKVP